MEPTQRSAVRSGTSEDPTTRPAPHPTVVVPARLDPAGSWALADGRWHWGRPEISHDPAVLDGTGRWIVCLPAQGPMLAARFPHSAPVRVDPEPESQGDADGLPPPVVPAEDEPPRSWVSSFSRQDYSHRVGDIRALIAAGDVYQVNLTRRLAGPIRRDHPGASALALTLACSLGVLASLLGDSWWRRMMIALGFPLSLALSGSLALPLDATAHRAPFGASLCLPELGAWVVGASPERFLSRDGDLVTSEPIKGTAVTAEQLTAKDRAENVMICDLVRNDLGRVCRMGSVEVPDLLRLESHPGLVHLVTTVSGRLRSGVGWAALFDAVFPPGSVTGAPKLAALEVIDALEAEGGGPYCGALGWVDADAQTADLAVSIRTFWAASADADWPDAWRWTFGTGGAITWDSDAEDEWSETELKAARLLTLAEDPLATRGDPLGLDVPAVRTW